MNSMVLPALRDDLDLLDGASDWQGSPTWMVYDVTRNRYFQIREAAYWMLHRWAPGLTVDAFAEQQGLDTGTVIELVSFLKINQLSVADSEQQAWFVAERARRKSNLLVWLIHNYLFIRIPLFKPDAFLRSTSPWLDALGSLQVVTLIRVLGILGVVLALQQWDQFLTTFLYFFSFQGLAAYAAALIVVKSLHELGHAFAAHRQGCKVASIGVAFLVLFPVLYTDTTDAWRLRQRRQKLRIAVAGIAVELHIALLATFLWAVLPDGVWRSVAFFLASTSWVTSLLINVTPFMRFDGYFALSDMLGIENLQSRAFAVARWRLREWLFGLNRPMPEPLNGRHILTFCAYSFGTWVYRFFLFLGIALLVYHFAFKVLGILLFLVEIVYFILLPVGREIVQWWGMRQQIKWNLNSATSLMVLSAVLMALLVPWRDSVHLPAAFERYQSVDIYSPADGVLVQPLAARGSPVEAGAVLAQVASPRLDFDAERTTIQIQALLAELERLGSSAHNADQLKVIGSALDGRQTELDDIRSQQAELILRADFPALVDDTAALQVGNRVSLKRPLLTVLDGSSPRVVAYLSEAQLRWVSASPDRATWTSGIALRPSLSLSLLRVFEEPTQDLKPASLSSVFGGPVAAVQDPQSGFQRPESAHFRVEFTVLGAPYASEFLEVGQVKLSTRRHSIAGQLWQFVVSALIRESGF